MARARLLHRPIDRLQGLPTALGQDRSKPEFARHPGRHFAAGPQAAIGRWLGQARTQPLEKRGPEHARHAPVAPAQVAQGLGPVRVVAGEQLLNPPSPETRHRRDIRDRVTPRQQPDHLNVPRRGRILGRPEPRFQIVHAQMISNPRHGSPPRLMAHQPTRCSTTQESSIRVHRPEPVSGIELCRRLRARPETQNLPIIMLTARGEEFDRVRGLATGADDYVVKPFSIPELMARVRAALRRANPHTIGPALRAGDLELDRETRRVRRAGQEVHLGPTEFRLLEYLMQTPGRVFTREQLLTNVWGEDAYVDERTVDVFVGRLRKALNQGRGPDPIRTVRGFGYAFDECFGYSIQ